MEFFFHQDNVPMHKTLDFTNETRDAGFELMAHPPYSPHIDPGDFYLFLKMKNIIQGQKLDREREREYAVKYLFFCDHESEFYKKRHFLL